MATDSSCQVKQLVQQHWDGRAKTFDEKSHHGLHSEEQHRAWISVLTDLVGDKQALQVLDVGCGTGFLSLLFAELGHQVTGVDMSEQMLMQAKQKARHSDLSVDFRLGDAEALEDEDARYDLVIERHIIWTLPNPEKAVREWLRVLKPGGSLALIEGAWGQNKHAEYREIHSSLPFFGGQPSDKLEAFLRENGIVNTRVTPLMEPTLWGEVPQHPRYLVVGLRGE
ncbi:SAM-dependent methyltransferase [Alicyclobacillus acidoterrestris]|uniref:class I SAM-dependent methyltransferase n=1 Tax=Alicyclobacillus suci TaxID=2816080 RepID=UPI00119389E0|nr:class I SAM-dependent methyltransferase [Alicyclobacillus suci]GEO24242.1 SAM-dependent methyltransferase [Alicyclobacillus acidoterrestris]